MIIIKIRLEINILQDLLNPYYHLKIFVHSFACIWSYVYAI